MHILTYITYITEPMFICTLTSPGRLKPLKGALVKVPVVGISSKWLKVKDKSPVGELAVTL